MTTRDSMRGLCDYKSTIYFRTQPTTIIRIILGVKGSCTFPNHTKIIVIVVGFVYFSCYITLLVLVEAFYNHLLNAKITLFYKGYKRTKKTSMFNL